MPRIHRFLICLALLGSLAPAPARGATIYDAVAEFSSTNGNPNGVWSYGDSPGATGAFTAHTDGFTSASTVGWLNSAGAFPTYYPLIEKNVTAGDLDLGAGQILPNDVLRMSPGCEPPTSYNPCGSGEAWSVLRFTAPGAGTFAFAGSLRGLVLNATAIAVTYGGAELDVLSGNTQLDGTEQQAFAFSLALLGGEAVDFRVGPRGTLIGDTTLLELTATVPEPSTLSLVVPALAVLGAARRRTPRIH